ncbi:MAG TPA: alpha/beta hydrolase [Planctomycetota bacterium]|nr:alpha/beta hydrolase [Planctomycetota bacterium]
MTYLLCGYLCLCAALYLFQKRFIYHPHTEASISPQDYGFGRSQAVAIETQSSDGVTLKGWHVAGRAQADREIMSLDLSKAVLVDLFFCGNGGNRADRSATFRRIMGEDVHTVCFDYRGYGDSGGSPSEEGLARDARAAWDFLILKGVPPKRIVIHGESLGGAVAIRLASELCAEGATPGGLITEATFPRLSTIAARQFPLVPVSLLLTEKFPSIERIGKVTCPILMLHGAQDELVPLSAGRELFAAAPEQSATMSRKEFVQLPTSGHNNMGEADAMEYRQALRMFYTKICPDLVITRDPNAKETKQKAREERKTPKDGSRRSKTKPAPPAN